MDIKTLVCFIGFHTIGFFAFGQSEPILVSGNYEEKPLLEWINDVERAHGVVFFFDQNQISFIKVTATFNQIPLSKCLDSILSGYQMNFIIYGNKVIISQEKIIKELPISYFNSQSEPDVSQTANEILSAGKTIVQRHDSVISIGTKATQSPKEKVTLSGHVKSIENGEDVIGALVYMKVPKIGVSTNVYGKYSIALPKGSYELIVQSVGMQDRRIKLHIFQDGNLDIELDEAIVALDEVVIKGDKKVNVLSLQTGLERMGIKTM